MKSQFYYYLFVIVLVYCQCTKEKIVVLSDEKEILSFSLQDVVVATQWEGQTLYLISYESIDLSKPYTPEILVSKNAIVSPPSGMPQIFPEAGVKYTVTAESGNIKEFLVKLIELDSNKKILSFTIPNKISNVIYYEEKINVEVYEHIDVSRLTPIITYSPMATISPKSGEEVDFTYPVTYTVTAQDGSTADYIVTVNNRLSRQNEIEKFELIDTQQIFEREGDNLFIYVPYETDVTNISTNIVVSDLASVSPASETFVNFSNPQIYTVTASDGTAKNYLVTVSKSPWREILENGEAPFLPVDGHQLVVYKDKMWLLGGWLGGENHDQATYTDGTSYWTSQVWCTTDGINWEFKGNAPWNGRHGFGCVVFANKIWIMGGDMQTDVWSSDDGESWNEISTTIPWAPRYFPHVVSFRDKIWVMGGADIRGAQSKFNDIWSTTDGITWIKEVEIAPWAPRGMLQGSAILNNILYFIGGSTYYSAAYNDVWSTTNGISWTQVARSTAWVPKQWHSIASFNNKLWILGGDTAGTRELTNEVWYSSNGAHWVRQKGIFWSPTHAAGVTVFNNKLWLIGGLESRVPSRVSNTVRMMDIIE